ncbi:MAG: helix-hairpin-helix domain-containing protein [Cruoricaptor ignavus]|nr:helix-hairpin-helix domain-containing protein [Cruoricaptor ignavus]
MRYKTAHIIRRKQLIALVVLGSLALFSQFLFSYFKDSEKPEKPNIVFLETHNEIPNLALSDFNPNDLDASQWQQLGFTEKQVSTILKYKDVVGGTFLSKEQLKKCYAISDAKFSQLEPYILLPNTNREFKNSNYKTFEKKQLSVSKAFNPDFLSVADWVKMGFTENQANAIIKYKNYLGGSFVSKEKFKECFIISDENYKKLAPFLILPEKTPQNFATFTKKDKSEKPKIEYQKFDPNTLNLQDWQKLGFSEKQAQVIVNYRDRNLKGSFKTLEDIKNCFVISEEKFEEMKPWIVLNPENISQNKNSEKPVEKSSNKTDFSKTDLNSITYSQLIEFGFDQKTSGGFISLRNKLGGFVNKNQIYEVYGIDRNIAEKLVSTTILNTTDVKKYSLSNAPESWLKTHPYFKYSADKIIFYRISESNDKKIWKFLKLKPEYEAKMRLYLE